MGKRWGARSWGSKFLPTGPSLRNLQKEGSNTQQGTICHLCGPGVTGSFQLGVMVWTQPTVARPPKPGEGYSTPHCVAANSCSARSPSRSLSCTTPSCIGASGPVRVWALWSSSSMELQEEPVPVAGPVSTQSSDWVTHSSILYPGGGEEARRDGREILRPQECGPLQR